MTNPTTTTTPLATLTLTGDQLEKIWHLARNRMDFCIEAGEKYGEDYQDEIQVLQDLRVAMVAARSNLDAPALAVTDTPAPVDTAEATAGAASQAVLPAAPAKKIVWRSVTSSNPDKAAIVAAIRAAAGVGPGKTTMVKISKDGTQVCGHVMTSGGVGVTGHGSRHRTNVSHGTIIAPWIFVA